MSKEDERGELTKILNDPLLQKDVIRDWDKKYARINRDEYNELIKPGIFIKYLTKDNKLRIGGYCIVNDPEEPYFVLQNPDNRVKWSVQKNNLKIVWGV